MCLHNKINEHKTIVKNKARLVTNGYEQEKSIDYKEIFAPIDRLVTIRMFLAFACHANFTLLKWISKASF